MSCFYMLSRIHCQVNYNLVNYKLGLQSMVFQEILAINDGLSNIGQWNKSEITMQVQTWLSLEIWFSIFQVYCLMWLSLTNVINILKTGRPEACKSRRWNQLLWRKKNLKCYAVCVSSIYTTLLGSRSCIYRYPLTFFKIGRLKVG